MIRFIQGKHTWFLLLMLIGAPVCLHSQVSTGSILGNVSDPSGALVNGASVTVTNVRTNEARNVSTNSNGLFDVSNLIPGTYDVTVVSAGFQAEKVTSVTLDVGAQREVDFQLKVGRQDQQITVTSTVSSVDLASSTTMPVSGRSYHRPASPERP